MKNRSAGGPTYFVFSRMLHAALPTLLIKTPTLQFYSFPKDADSFGKIYVICHFEHALQVELLK